MINILFEKTEKGWKVRGPWWFWLLVFPIVVGSLITLSKYGVFDALAKIIHG